jgi:hypothetical protein
VDSSFLSLLTRPVVRRELVRDKAIQEGIDLVRDGSVGGPMRRDTNRGHSQNMPTRSVPIIRSCQ